jgi:hypothetical protein
MEHRTNSESESDDQAGRVRHFPTPVPAWSPAVRQLRSDPTLPFTAHGRTLLRLLNSTAMNREEWTILLNNVPPHCRPAITTVAMEWAHFWHAVVEDLRLSSSCAA